MDGRIYNDNLDKHCSKSIEDHVLEKPSPYLKALDVLAPHICVDCILIVSGVWYTRRRLAASSSREIMRDLQLSALLNEHVQGLNRRGRDSCHCQILRSSQQLLDIAV